MMTPLQIKYSKYNRGYSTAPVYFIERFESLTPSEKNLFIEKAIERELIQALSNARISKEAYDFLYSRSPSHIKAMFAGRGKPKNAFNVKTAI